MNRIVRLFLILGIVAEALLLTSCSGMADNIDQYLSEGEIIYIAKSDSVHIYPGKERFKIEFWISDPRASRMTVFWNQKKNSQEVDIPSNRDNSMPIDMMINGIEEGDYIFQLVTEDSYGNTSVPDVQVVSVYGETFQSSLTNRNVKSATVSKNKVTVTWGKSYSSLENGIVLYYSDIEGNEKTLTIPLSDLGSSTIINDVDVSKEMSYQTIFLPSPNALDLFYAERAIISLN